MNSDTFFSFLFYLYLVVMFLFIVYGSGDKEKSPGILGIRKFIKGCCIISFILVCVFEILPSIYGFIAGILSALPPDKPVPVWVWLPILIIAGGVVKAITELFKNQA